MPVGAAALGASVVGAGASIYAGDKAKNASNKATDKTLALQKSQADQTRSDLVPFMQPGYAAAGALGARFGLGGSSPNALTGQPAGSSVVGGGGSYTGSSYGGSGGAQYLPGSMTPAGAAGFSTADLAQIRQDNPGIAAEFQRASAAADPNSPAFKQQGLDSLDNYTKYWNDNIRNPADYSLGQGHPGTAQPTTSPAQPGGAASGPGVPTGTYGDTANPSYKDPGNFTYTAADYTASPAYAYQLDQALKGTEATAAATGSLKSGAAAKALQDRAQNMGLADFSNERSVANANFDTDRAFNRQTYTDDRNYLSGRYDTETGNLFNLAGMGENAAAGAGNAGAHYADTASNALTGNAATVGNADLAGAGSVNALLGTGVNAFAYSQGKGTPATVPATSNTYAYTPSAVNLSGYTPTPVRY